MLLRLSIGSHQARTQYEATEAVPGPTDHLHGRGVGKGQGVRLSPDCRLIRVRPQLEPHEIHGLALLAQEPQEVAVAAVNSLSTLSGASEVSPQTPSATGLQ